jgi:nitrite reductase (cytochrome c-552)
MGFHAPQEAAMVLGEALDYARQGELAATRWQSAQPAPAASAPAAAPKAQVNKP